jgi:hypothetical protein
VLDVGDYLQNPEVLKELFKKLSAISQITNQLLIKVAKPHKAVLAGGDLKTVIKPKGGYIYKDRPFI